MKMLTQDWTQQRTENIMGLVLRLGVLAAGTVVLLGGILYLVQHGGDTADYRVFRGQQAGICYVHEIARGALARQSRCVMQLGVLLLIVTPVARVAMSLAVFLWQRDRLYIMITTVVLALLLYSLSGLQG
jgi:uncharacterized membrane protein